MIFIRNSRAFVQQTSLPEFFRLKFFSYKICQLTDGEISWVAVHFQGAPTRTAAFQVSPLLMKRV